MSKYIGHAALGFEARCVIVHIKWLDAKTFEKDMYVERLKKE